MVEIGQLYRECVFAGPIVIASRIFQAMYHLGADEVRQPGSVTERCPAGLFDQLVRWGVRPALRGCRHGDGEERGDEDEDERRLHLSFGGVGSAKVIEVSVENLR